MLRAFQLSEDNRGGKAYGGYLEARAKDPDSAVNDASLAELRRGWYLGEKGFGEKVLEAISDSTRPKRKKVSLGGEAAKAHDPLGLARAGMGEKLLGILETVEAKANPAVRARALAAPVHVVPSFEED